MRPGGWRERQETQALAAVVAICAGLLAMPFRAHIDDSDAMLYRVVVRHMVEDGAWLNLRYLPRVYPQFREHLPFGFWPYAAAVRLFGEGALPVVGAAVALGMLGVTGAVARRLFGTWGAVVALGALGCAESFFNFAARARLDGELMLLANLAAAPILLGRVNARAWLWAGASAAAAVLVKGPFGLVPLAAASAALALTGRPRALLMGAVTGVAACLPLGAFLYFNRRWGDGSWWNGYAVGQLFASASGARTDGQVSALVPLQAVAGRFWPGLPVALLGAWAAFGLRRWVPSWLELGPERRNATRRVALCCAFMLLALALPSRKLWYHALVAFPGLALLAGAGGAAVLERWAGQRTRARFVIVALWAAALVVWISAGLGVGRRVEPTRQVACAEFHAWFEQLPPHAPVRVVAPQPWSATATLAAEYRLDPVAEAQGTPEGARAALESAPETLALVSDEVLTREPAGWSRLAQARGWTLLRRK